MPTPPMVPVDTVKTLADSTSKFWNPLYTKTMLVNMLAGALGGGLAPALGGSIGAMLFHKLNTTGTLGGVFGGPTASPMTPLFFGSVLGNLLGRSQSRGRRLEAGSPFAPEDVAPETMPLVKKQIPMKTEQAMEPELPEQPMDMKKESSMPNTVEELFKAATQALEEKVFLPTVLAKLAERGYQAENQEQFNELLKHANIVREGIAAGKISPVPARELDTNGQITKAASEKASQDFLAFAPEVELKLAEVEPVVKEAAEVLTWGFMQSVHQQQAAAKKA